MNGTPLIGTGEVTFLNRLDKNWEAQKDAIRFTREREPKLLEFMESHYPDVFLEQIDHTVLRGYVSRLKENHSAGGINHHIKVLKILFKFMIEEGEISENPSKKISRIKTDQTAIATFSNSQIMAMLEVTKHQMDFPGIRNYALITLLYDTGCRIWLWCMNPLRC